MSFRSAVADLFADRANFDLMGRRRLWFLVSGLAVVVSVASLGFRGLNLGIEFEGGTVLQAPVEDRDAKAADVRDVLRDIGEAQARITILSNGGDEQVRVQSETVDADEVAEIRDALAKYGNVPPDAVSVSSVGPTFGEQVTEEAVRALVFFLLAVLLYLAFRFEWKMAVAAVVALFHDLVITVGVYSISGFEVTPATVIAVLTILGYSLYDTVVVFDKVKENAARLGSAGRHTYSDVVNRSLNETLMRSMNTSITTLLPVISLLVVGAGLLGALAIREFALALFVGLLLGAYSSIFTAAPVLTLMKEREPRYRQLRQRIEARAAATGRPSPEPVPAATGAPLERAPTADDTSRQPGSDRERAHAERPTAPVGEGGVAPKGRKPRRQKRRR